MQLVCDYEFSAENTFASFVAGGNSMLITALHGAVAGDPSSSIVYFYGDHGTGRTHLIKSVLRECEDRRRSAVLISMSDRFRLSPRTLSRAREDVILIDDVDQVAGDTEWEHAIYEIVNSVKGGSGQSLVVSSLLRQGDAGFSRKDIVTRLSWGVTFHVEELSDDDKLKALEMRAALRGMKLTDETARFMITRLPRSMKDLMNALCMLEHSLEDGHRLSYLTIPFVKKALGI